MKVSDIESLIFREPDDGLDVNRKQLFKWILLENVDDSLNINELFQLPQKFICTIATLYYLVKVRFRKSTKSSILKIQLQEGCLTVLQADILLLSIFEISPVRSEVKVPEYLLKDAFLNVFMYLKMYNFLTRVFQTVGLKCYVDFVQFDGFLYHSLHQEWPVLEDVDKEEKLKTIDGLRLYSRL